jgi:hypothetical protein
LNGPDGDDAIVEASMELIRMFGRRDRLADTLEAVEDAGPQVIWLALASLASSRPGCSPPRSSG